MKTVAERWRRLLRTIMEDQEPDEAVETILLLFEPRQMVVPTAPEPTDPPKPLPPARRAAVAPRPEAANGRPPAKSVPVERSDLTRVLKELRLRMSPNGECMPFEFFTAEEAAVFIGVSTSRIYQILELEPPKLAFEKVKGALREEYRLRGRELNIWRKERERGGETRPDDADENEDDDESDHAPPSVY